MKKLISLILIVTMMTAMAGCGEKKAEAGSVYEDTTAVLSAVTSNMTEFPSFGGNMSSPVENAPGKLDVTDTDTMTSMLLLPEDIQKAVTEVSTQVHMMNSNTFTSAALKLDGMDLREAANSLEAAAKGTQFMCGMPDGMVIAAIDGYLVYAYGITVNIDVFRQNIEGIEGAEILVDCFFEV